jgi:hypothetical protein
VKKLIILAIAMFALIGCAALNRESGGFFQRLNQERNLAKAVKLLGEGNETEASGLLAEITSAKGIAGVTDEALFRLSLMHLRPGMEKNELEQSQKILERLRKEYPASSWTRMAWPLMEFLTSVEELRRQNRNLKILNLSLNKENKELQSLKSLNLSLTRENKELRQSIELLKHLDLELEQKTRH